MKAAGDNLVPVTLELGGKSPTIVARGRVRDQAVSDIIFGKLLSGGQTCIAPDYALVHESEIDAFIAGYDTLVKAAYPDGPTSDDYTSIIEVGHRPGDAARRPHTLAPTVVLGVTDDMRIAHEEIRPHPADLRLPRHRRRHQLRQRTTPAARALLLR